MTDSQTATLSVILDQLNHALTLTGDDLLTMQEQFGTLWQDAEQRADDGAKQAIVTAWERAQNLANTSAEAARAATTAGTLAHEAIAQRDAMFGQLQDLETAISDADTDHPLVAALVEDVEERTAEQIGDTYMIEAYDQAFDEASETLVDNLANATGCRWNECNVLLAVISGSYGGLNEDELALLRPLITEVNARVDRLYADLRARA
jgi:hypothetical protein